MKVVFAAALTGAACWYGAQRQDTILDAVQTVAGQIRQYETSLLLAAAVTFVCALLYLFITRPAVPDVTVDLSVDELSEKRVSTTDLTIPSRPGVIQCYSPATMQFLGEIPIDDASKVKAVVAKARELQKSWAQTSFGERRRVLRTMYKAIMKYQDDIVRISCIDTGKPRVDAQFGEIVSSLGKLSWVINKGEAVLSPESRATDFTSMHKRARVEFSPLGVVGVIAPWNYPFYNLYNHIASALFAGNAVVLKISEYSAWAGSKYVRLARACLAACGHDADLVQLVQGLGETGAALVSTADKIIFTGSPGVGKLVMRGASSTLTPLVLELGGKDPFIVCDDVNVDNALPLALRGTFQNSGQNCVGIERIYVYERIYDSFVAKAAKAVQNLRQGPPVDPATGEFTQVDVGCITTAMQLDIIDGLVKDAVSKGARLLAGGKSYFKSGSGTLSQGLFYAPTLLADVTHEMRIANEEVFGPVMCVFKVAGNSDDAVVAMANSTEYGLGGTVYSSNPTRANHIAARLRCGMVGVNAFGLNYLVQDLPFGGIKASGFDRFAGPEGLRACCLMKSVVTDILPFISIPTPVPKPLQYPIPATAPAFTKALIDLQFAQSFLGKLKGIFGLAANGQGGQLPDESKGKKQL